MRDAAGNPLWQAFDVLLSAAEPGRRDQVLRNAIAQLIDDGAPPAPPFRLHAGPIATRQPERWDRLRPQLRALIAGGHDRRAVADNIGVAVSTLARLLGANSDGPGIGVIERAEAWLSQILLVENAPAAGNEGETAAHDKRNRPFAVPTGDLATPENGSKIADGANLPKPALARPEPAPSRPGNRVVPSPAGNGHERGEGPPGRLSSAERERLAAATQLLGDREVRRELQLTRDLLDQALTGAEIAAPALTRMRGWLNTGSA